MYVGEFFLDGRGPILFFKIYMEYIYHLIILIAIHAVAPTHLPPPPFVPRPVRSNAPLTIEIGQSNKHFYAIDITSLSF